MSNDKPTAKDWDDDKAKLPPRSDDWRSGLNRDEPETRQPATSFGSHTDTTDWDPVNENEAEPTMPESVPVKPQHAEGKPVGPTVPVNADHAAKASVPPAAPGVPPDETVPPKGEGYEYFSRKSRFSDVIIGLILAAIAFVAVATTYNGIGHSWDEALYLKPAQQAMTWVMGAINSGDDAMLQRDAIDRYWGQYLDTRDPLHPEIAPIPKLLIGSGLAYLQKPLHIDPMTASRLPMALLFGLTVGLLYLLGTKEYGRIGGFAAAIFYVLMPRVFGHAHIAASETALTFFVVLTVWCYLIGNRFWPFALFTGIALGMAIDSKITALMLPLPLILWGQIYRRRYYASNVFAMVFIAPLIVVALWPWLWHDGIKRFFAYLMFYLDHQSTAVYYMGRTWGYTHNAGAPFYYAPHMAALSLPVWVLFFLAVGILRAIFSTISRPVTVLFVLVAAAWLGISMLPGAPRYDGVRLFFPCFAFVSLVAAGGFSMIFVGVHGWRRRRDSTSASRETGYIAAIALFIVLVYGIVDLFFTHPNELNYYNWLVGKSAGAYEQGYETSYWGEAVNSDVTTYLSGILKPGDKVKTLALNETAFDNLRQWGKLPANVDFSPDEPPYDYVIMQVRQGFMGPVELRLMSSKKPLRTFSKNGVPRILVFDGKTVNDVFPKAPAQQTITNPSIFDQATTPTAREFTSASLTADTTPQTSATTPVADQPTSATSSTPQALETSSVAVLDLPTSASETTATADRLTTMPAMEMMNAQDMETSAPGTYEGNLPSTSPVLSTPTP